MIIIRHIGLLEVSFTYKLAGIFSPFFFVSHFLFNGFQFKTFNGYLSRERNLRDKFQFNESGSFEVISEWKLCVDETLNYRLLIVDARFLLLQKCYDRNSTGG